MQVIKYLFVASLFFAGFVCGGAVATKKYSDRLVEIDKAVDLVNIANGELAYEVLACKTALDMGKDL